MDPIKLAVRREYQRQWRLSHPDSERESGRKYRASQSGQEKRRVRNRRWDANNREARNRATAAYRLRNPEKIKAKMRAYFLKRKYGITPQQFEEKLAIQRGVCAVCKQPEVVGKRLSVDHCHTTGVVRGLLCSNCNTALGLLQDSQTILDSAKEYLKKYDTHADRV